MVPMHQCLKMGPLCSSVCHKIISVYSGHISLSHVRAHAHTDIYIYIYSEHKMLFFLMLILVVHIPTTELQWVI